MFSTALCRGGTNLLLRALYRGNCSQPNQDSFIIFLSFLPDKWTVISQCCFNLHFFYYEKSWASSLAFKTLLLFFFLLIVLLVIFVLDYWSFSYGSLGTWYFIPTSSLDSTTSFLESMFSNVCLDFKIIIKTFTTPQL